MTINAYLKRIGLAAASPKEKASKLGISSVTLWRILNKKTGISTTTIAKIERETGGLVKYRDLAEGASAEASE